MLLGNFHPTLTRKWYHREDSSITQSCQLLVMKVLGYLVVSSCGVWS